MAQNLGLPAYFCILNMAEQAPAAWTDAEEARREPNVYRYMWIPLTAPFHVTDKRCALKALESIDGVNALYDNHDRCKLRLYWAQTGAEYEHADEGEYRRMKQTLDFYYALWPRDVYGSPNDSSATAWSGNRTNQILMEVLSTIVVGNFPRNDGETQNAYLVRAAGQRRLFQQVYPLPPACNGRTIMDFGGLGHCVNVAMLVAIWTWHKIHGGFPYTRNSDNFGIREKQLFSAQRAVDESVVITLAEIHYRGFGGHPLFTSTITNMTALKGLPFNNEIAYNSVLAFVRYLLTRYNYNPVTGRHLTIASIERKGDLHEMRKSVYAKASKATYSDNYLVEATTIEETEGTVDYTRPISVSRGALVKGALFFPNWLIFDTLVPDFRWYFDDANRLVERCNIRVQYITDRERGLAMPRPPDERWNRIHQNPLTMMSFIEPRNSNSRNTGSTSRNMLW